MTSSPGSSLSRRRLLSGGAAAFGGVLAGGIGGAVAGHAVADRAHHGDPGTPGGPPAGVGTATEPFHGPRQAGVATPAQAHAAFVALTLHRDVDRPALGRMLRLLTDDAARLTQGEPALADTEPELALLPARLTVTFGFGPGLYRAAGVADRRPPSVAELPAFPQIDRLEPRWCGGDLLLQICADDPITVTHAQRMLVKDARPFATVRWVQRGFRRAAGVREGTQRNLMGQLDGTTNPRPGTEAFERAVWAGDSTTVVIRRIRVELETWDELGRTDKELVIGRRLDSGAPLTGAAEHDPPDFAASDAVGFPVIPEFSHIRRAHVPDENQRMLRRPYHYDGPPDADGRADSGMIFVAYQADIDRQFIPVQRRLAEQDLLNKWTTPIGSAVFAIPPGCRPGGWIGEEVLG